MRLVVVSDRRWQKWAARVVDAGKWLGMPSELWDELTYQSQRDRVTDCRVLVFGDVPSALTPRSMARRGLDEGGLCWAKRGDHAYVWLENWTGSRGDRRAIEHRRDRLREAAFQKRDLGRDSGRATGAMIAHTLQLEESGRRHVTLRSRGGLQRAQREYALLHFLLHGFDRWCELALTPVMSQQREARPEGSFGSSFVEYHSQTVRHPTSTAPSPTRRESRRVSSVRSREDLEREMSRAQERVWIRERTLERTPVGAPGRRMREHELQLARKHARKIRAQLERLKDARHHRADAS